MELKKKLRELDDQAWLIREQRNRVLRSPEFDSLMRNADAAVKSPSSYKFGNALDEVANDLEDANFDDVFNVSDLQK